MSGIQNPIGIKLSSKVNERELVQIIKKLNPENNVGKIVLVTRLGVDNVESNLPRFIEAIDNESNYYQLNGINRI